MPEWFGALTHTEKDALKAMTDARGQSLNTLEKALGVIPALNDFARPLLTQALTALATACRLIRCLCASTRLHWMPLASPQAGLVRAPCHGFKRRCITLKNPRPKSVILRRDRALLHRPMRKSSILGLSGAD